MKKNLIGMAAMLLLALMTGMTLTSCGSDGKLDEPEYAASSAKYVITTPNTGIESIELTESGDYIVVGTGYYYRSTKGETAHKPFIGSREQTRAQYGDISYGHYTKTGENRYNLEGYGVITVVKDGNNVVSLDIVKDNGQTIKASATVDKGTSSDMTNKLCRTWNIEKYRLKMEFKGVDLQNFDKTGSMEEIEIALAKWARENGAPDDFVPDFMDDEMPEKVIFTRAGTYMVLYTDNELDVAMWKWEDEKKGILRYCWDDDDWDDDDSLVEVSFSGDTLTISETYMEMEGLFGINMTLGVIMKAAK